MKDPGRQTCSRMLLHMLRDAYAARVRGVVRNLGSNHKQGAVWRGHMRCSSACVCQPVSPAPSQSQEGGVVVQGTPTSRRSRHATT